MCHMYIFGGSCDDVKWLFHHQDDCKSLFHMNRMTAKATEVSLRQTAKSPPLPPYTLAAAAHSCTHHRECACLASVGVTPGSIVTTLQPHIQ